MPAAGEDHACCHRFVTVTDIVHVQSEEVRGAVHEVLLVQRLLLVLAFHLIGLQQPEFDQFVFITRPTSSW